MKKLLYFAAAAVLVIATGVSREFTPQSKVALAEAVVANYYVDTVNENKLVEDAIRGMLEELDPHSSYTTPEETKEMNEPLAGNFSGIGITFNMSRDTLFVISTVSGGPSEKVGIMAGDRMIAVNDTAIAGVKMKNSDIMKRLRGEKGTIVNVKVLRKVSGGVDTIDFRIKRDEIPIYSIDASYMVSPGIGYIRINRFAAETAKEFRKALADLQKKGLESLIIDITDNGGGYLHSPNEILGELLEPGAMTVYTEGLKSPRQELHARPSGNNPMFPNGRVVVMANQNSASASEIMSGAIQDWDRGLIVGRRTFGKGLVQRPFPFPDGSMIRLTIAHYYTPTGRNIQKPYDMGKGKEYAHDIVDRLNSGELMHADSVKFVDSLKVHTIRNHRAVYGGGGIFPDRFVPLDTMSFTKYYRDVMAKGVFNTFISGFLDKERKNLKKKYHKDEEFVASFEVTEPMMKEFVSIAEQEGVPLNAEDFERSRSLIAMYLKALVGRDVYDAATFYKVFNMHDPVFKAAYDLIRSDEYDKLLKATDPLIQ